MEDRCSAAEGFDLNQYRPSIRRICLRMVSCSVRAEELTQDTLVVGLANLQKFRQADSLRAWLLGIARNLCRNDRRKHRAFLTEDGCGDVADESESTLDRLLRRERDEWVRARAEVVLDPIQLRAVELRYRDGCSEAEIRATLGLRQASGARGLLQTCRRRLQAELSARRADFT